jgi:shikimate kinase
MKILYLCGFMGCGKSTSGMFAAQKLRVGFVDLDSYIEKSAMLSIPEIFAAHGESRFRELETAAITEASESISGIIALGGGAVIKPENITAINKYGVLVYIDTDFAACYERIKADPNRPLAAKSREELETLYEARTQIYFKNAKHIIDGNAGLNTLTERVVKMYANL